MLVTGLGLMLMLHAAPEGQSAPFIQGRVPSENGFEGAVKVVEEAGDQDYGYVTVNIPYRDVRGQAKMGQGRLFLRRADLESGRPVPAFCHVHYEMDANGAKKWCDRGWAVATGHYGTPEQGGCPLELFMGDSYNLAKALIQWVRRLSFIDRSRLHITGASAGGYMTLMMSAECFPVTSLTADVPVVNWAYNLSYFEASRGACKYPVKEMKDSPMPVLCSVIMVADWSYGVFGNDLTSDTWYRVSPISQLDRITCPALVYCATGDMLVPHDQMSRKYPRPIDPALFPEGFTRDFDTLTLVDKARKRFDELIPEKQLFVHVEPVAPDLTEYTLEHILKAQDPPAPPEKDRPWSREKQWSLVILDEGPPLPHSPHSRYRWATSPDSFLAVHKEKPPAVSLLNAPKLDRLMQRYTGELEGEPVLADGKPTNRLNFEALEKLDVVTGLLDYAAFGKKHANQLIRLYAAGKRKPFGDTLSLARIEEICQGMLAQLNAER